MDYSNQRILVVGGAGFIGSHLVDSLAVKQPEALYVVDNLFLGRKENLVEARRLYSKLHFHMMDATDERLIRGLIRREKIGVVFNLATKALGYSFVDPPDSFHVNVQIIGHLLESLRLGEISHLVHFSSSEAYGTAIKVPMNENHPLAPNTPYAAGKAAADLLIRSYQESFGLKVLTLRPFNNYGSRQNEGLYAGIIPITIQKLLKGQPPIIQGDGLQTRDFIYVLDTVQLALSLASREDLYGSVINLGTGRETSINMVINYLCQIAFYKGYIKKESFRPGDVKRHCADIKILKSLVKNLSLTSLKKGLSETWKWYAEHNID